MLLLKVFGRNTELFEEDFTEIGWRIDTYQITNLSNAVFTVEYQFGCLFQADQTDEVVRR